MDWKSKKLEAILEQALVEDKATNDITTAITVDPKLRASATVIAKQDCVISGLGSIPRFLDIFSRLDKKASGRYEVISHPEMFDGVRVKKGQALAVIRHNARVILACERVILNLMQRMSGIATATREYADAIKGTNAKVLDTRKTVPGLRLLDKYAVRCGGGENHRLDLSDGILIKNNHISLGGGVETVLKRARELRQPGQVIDIEVRTFDELNIALENGAESLLIDNMTPAQVKKAVGIVRAFEKERGVSIPTEASGGITIENIRKYALAGVDYISVGALTHSAVAVDLSMRITAEIY
ncbi:carboxylating nicotinate-nucleotide diphosphorylase [Silvibacterium dinghuense]|uniref:Probable nicotinate-nucleotide pyrophosphorylase [carboxylating] n=1 Tax=Silvibacterium dinghuense TaxID=1560006 RepID=A0A4Q1SHP7_9BACT|nr:carboxylating nicotinate-nucleotide diphosphorylase [Silvibacterium dinghuense]RXS97086.1 carboxylating nicotinate-nucleotide diphosphorylase [Silvibacterium dinghuense]GGG96094.1 nicotinate-nucleotide diphosphorylase (carboxylating) [Silvibacterium dinghuense]